MPLVLQKFSAFLAMKLSRKNYYESTEKGAAVSTSDMNSSRVSSLDASGEEKAQETVQCKHVAKSESDSEYDKKVEIFNLFVLVNFSFVMLATLLYLWLSISN